MGSVPVESELDALSNSVPDLIASGDIQGAEKACRELLERHPGQVDGLKRFAEVYQAKGDAAKAAEYLRKSAGFMLASPEGRSPEAIQLLLDEANAVESSAQRIDSVSEDSEDFVGYAALNIFEQCYEYNENACYIADSRESMRRFLTGAMVSLSNYRIDPVSISDLEQDFGASSGEYALEMESLERFKRTAQARGMEFRSEPYDEPFGDQPELFVVNFTPRRD